MKVLVCVKRVPAPGGRITLTEDQKEIVTRNLGFTISPHEECAVEEAIRIRENHGGTVTVLTLGSEMASEQLRHAMAMGADEGILLKSDVLDWNPMSTANAISEALVESHFDLILFGNESADSGGYQVGIRVANTLGLPCISGAKSIEIDNQQLTALREAYGGLEKYQLSLPAVVSVKEGINLPRYPSLPGRMRARRKAIEESKPVKIAGGLTKIRFQIPEELGSNVKILGKDKSAVPEAIRVLVELQNSLPLAI